MPAASEATVHADDLYAQLEALPENLTGEIIDGQLHTQPRPASPHAVASSALGMDIGSAYHRGRGGPGGWWILDEPEIHFVRDREVLVPDLAGWRRERMPRPPRDQRFVVVPDWVCEVVSPSTARKDRVLKMSVYARYGVRHLWLVDPLAHTLEVFALRDGSWTVIGLFQENDAVSVEPFGEIALELGTLWTDTGDD
ncbi:MAG TPA: Uma2 family endonuclease [Accumulibacter sp.]|uniref:Uma2 family endonuclease n=1 Tax=Accumulibacter sp. TaxID=2053492 RepID=UPI0025D495D2|nr:Uma2 family endonuclease [Accumulibacter sp.]MCM8600444.1 Uma2 family endonuclease [Accumulibacter sp.]MCM8664626.1 Uma2 family endonuclease [Accumulibacter sp.]HNC53336.1 Uma2 family endonuclease [Accumulibacter sp.]